MGNLVLALLVTTEVAALDKQHIVEMISIGAYRAPARAAQRAQAAGSEALIAIGRYSYRLQVVQCQIADWQRGRFEIYARQAAGLSGGELWLSGKGPDAIELLFSIDRPRRAWVARPGKLSFDGEVLRWSGSAGYQDVVSALQLTLRCAKPEPEHG